MYVATSSHMEPSKKFHVEEEEEVRECVALASAFYNRHLLCASCKGQPDLCGGIFVEVLCCIGGICREAQVLHNP